jgi:31-O-methyltransferase
VSWDTTDAVLCRLPNGMEMYCVDEAEAATLYREIFTARCWLDRGLRIAEGDTVVDVGANVGIATLFFHLEQPGLRILSFEPAPAPFHALRRNVELHGINAVCRPVALGASPGETVMTYYPAVSTMSGLYADPSEDAAITRAYLRNSGFSEEDTLAFVPSPHVGVEIPCRVETLSDELRVAEVDRVDLLKIDVEKGELGVLRGIAEDIWPLIGQIALEVHDMDGTLMSVVSQLRAAGFEPQVRQDPLLAGTGIYDVAGVRRKDARP